MPVVKEQMKGTFDSRAVFKYHWRSVMMCQHSPLFLPLNRFMMPWLENDATFSVYFGRYCFNLAFQTLFQHHFNHFKSWGMRPSSIKETWPTNTLQVLPIERGKKTKDFQLRLILFFGFSLPESLVGKFCFIEHFTQKTPDIALRNLSLDSGH